MSTLQSRTAVLSKPFPVALAGAASLAIAMGIGRFAFTPLLPMMLSEKIIDLHLGSELATANYLGYLAGAVLAAAQPRLLDRFAWLPMPSASVIVRWGLLATAVLTAAMALDAPGWWPALRFMAGFGSAYVLVFTSGWCLAHLARHDRSHWGGIVFSGPGIGIAISGLAAGALVPRGAGAEIGWVLFGVLSALFTAVVWRVFRGPEPVHGLAANAAGANDTVGSNAEITLLVIAYGLEGFGYIVTATFLPVIARDSLPASGWLDLFWPIFGVGATAGSLLTLFVPRKTDPRNALAFNYAVQAVGVAFTLFAPNLPGFAVGSLLVGLPFTVITFFAMQEARRFRPHRAAALMGVLTAVYGIGQIAGPPLVAVLLAHASSHARGFNEALMVASSSLALGCVIFVSMGRRWPLVTVRA
jgi:MFS family permease